MPTGKNKRSSVHIKPQASVHPSLEKRSRINDTTSSHTPDYGETLTPMPPKPVSVNDQLEHLRRTQAPRMSAGSLANLVERLQVGPHSITSPRRSGIRPAAGPPPPRSWTERGKASSALSSRAANAAAHSSASLSTLPGIEPLPQNSLVHQTLKSIAMDWEWHLTYDHVFMSLLPINLKTLLLCYIAKYATPGTLTIDGIRTIFHETDETSDETNSAKELQRLELGNSIGYSFPLRDLDKMWTQRNRGKRRTTPVSTDSTTSQSSPLSPPLESTPNSWSDLADDDDRGPSLPPLQQPMHNPLRFPSLTHLSLANPGPNTTWTSLLTFARAHLTHLTHLSLASWPAPSLPAPARHEPLADPTLDAHYDAAHLLRQLARATPSLTYLNLDGSHPWLAPALLGPVSAPVPAQRRPSRRWDAAFDAADDAPPATTAGPLRTGGWPRLAVLHVAQPPPPGRVPSHVLAALAVPITGREAPFLPVGAAALRMPEERYSVACADGVTAEAIAAGVARREWVRAEELVRRVEWHVNAARRAGTGGRSWCVVDRGWEVGVQDGEDVVRVR